MEVIGYGILIAALMGISAFAGAWFAMRLKSPTPFWQLFPPEKGDNGEGAIVHAARIKPLRYDSEPRTAEEFKADYKPDTYSEALNDATRS
jgi:hypothetical protein